MPDPTTKNASPPVLVICLEGCHGSGKTQLTKSFSDAGHLVLDEGFLDMPNTALHPQSLVMESTWVASWFRRLVDVAKSAEKNKLALIADRSPLSAVFYALRNGGVLEPLIRACIDEVREVCNIHIISVHLRTDRDLLWSRIQERLKREPHRAAYREDSEKWMDDTLTFYDSMQWDYTVSNNNVNIEDLRTELMASIAASYGDEHEMLLLLNRPIPRPSGCVVANYGITSPSKLETLLGESPMKKRNRTPSKSDGEAPFKRAHFEDSSPFVVKSDVEIIPVSFVAKTPAIETDRRKKDSLRQGPAVVTPSGDM